MKIRKALLFMILFMICLIFLKDKHANGEYTSHNGGVSLSPAYLNLGSIKKGNTFTVNVMNKGQAVRLKAKIDNAENVNITVTPDTFSLAKNEQKDVTITLKNDDTLKIGAYDLSISFLTETDGSKSITAYATNSLRLKFKKNGLALASCNVKDIPPIQETPFYSILSNFYSKRKEVTVNIDIKNKASGDTVWQQSETITMKPYPDTGFYGKVTTPLPESQWEYGDYLYCLTAQINNKTLLTYQASFNVGEMKGKLDSVTVKDVCKGHPAKFKAQVTNIGSQELPVTARIAVKDKKSNLIYENMKMEALIKSETKSIIFEWPTKYSKTGRYSVDYVITMGNQKEAGTLYYQVTIPDYIWFIIISCIIIGIIILLIIILRYQKKHYNVMWN
jgi:hypothetical protein